MSGINSSGQFPFSGGVAVILLALGVFIIADDPFQPTRPDVTNNLTKNTENVRARLWQDPFEPLGAHRNEKHNHDDLSSENEGSNIENHKHVKCYVGSKDGIAAIKNKLIPKNKHKPEEEINSKDERKANENIQLLSPVRSTHDLDELLCQLQKNIKPDIKAEADFNDLHIIAVMVTGAPYAEDKELRIRSRYTLTTGLLTTGYHPVDSQHIGYLDFARLCRVANKKDGVTTHSDHCDMPDVVPYELFKLSNHAKLWRSELYAENILILWIEDEAISKDKPLKMLSQLKKKLVLDETDKNILLIDEHEKAIHERKIKIKFDVIGPAGSTTLVKMHNNLMTNDNFCDESDIKKCNQIIRYYGDGRDENGRDKIRVFSHRATLDDGAIRQSLNTDKQKLEKKQNDHLYFPGFRRTIVTDSVLVDNLLCEMLRRGINPFHNKNYIYTTHSSDGKELQIGSIQCSKIPYDAINKNGKKDYIVLLGEGDTSY